MPTAPFPLSSSVTWGFIHFLTKDRLSACCLPGTGPQDTRGGGDQSPCPLTADILVLGTARIQDEQLLSPVVLDTREKIWEETERWREEVTFEQVAEGGVGGNHMDDWEMTFRQKEHMCKGPGAGHSLALEKKAKGPVYMKQGE